MKGLIPSYSFNDRRNGHARTAEQASDSLFPHSQLQSDGMRLRVTVPCDQSGTKQAISKYDWQRSLSLSRQLYARLGEVSGAINQKSLYTIGDAWSPLYCGQDEAWGEAATEWLEQWFGVCDIRGEPYDFYTDLFIDSVAMDRCGDAAMVCVKVSGEPRLQFLPAHRISSRFEWSLDSSGFSVVADGQYKGARSYNGVIFDRNGKVIAYNILGEDLTKFTDRQIPTQSCQLLYEPHWADQGRGIPRLATCLLPWMDYEDIQYFLKRQVKQDSAQGIMHYNEDGAAETGRDFIQQKDIGLVNNDVKVEQLEGNEIMYFKALGGGKLEAFRSDRPHPNVDAHMVRVMRGCYLAMGWFYELTDPSAMGGANTRLIQDMARFSVLSRQTTSYKRAIRAVMFGLSCAMDLGDIPRNDTDWHKWDFNLPPRLTVDQRYDEKTAMEQIKMAAGTYADFFGGRGGFWKQKFKQRIAEQKFIEEECEAQGVDVNKVQILTPNGNSALGAAPDDQADNGDDQPEDNQP